MHLVLHAPTSFAPVGPHTTGLHYTIYTDSIERVFS